MDKAWFVDYKCGEWDHSYIVIHCEKRSDVQKMLKRHLNHFNYHDFSINRITPWEANRETPDDWVDYREENNNE